MVRRRASAAAALGLAAVALVAACGPVPGGWSATASMATPRLEHAASLISATGRVLVSGGRTDAGGAALRSVERYDPGTGRWTTVAPMGGARAGHTSTALANGRILVAGGSSAASAEVFDGPANSWTATGPMRRVRTGHFAARLSNGRVLVAGGGQGAEYYNPATNTWTATGAIPSSVSVPPSTPDVEYRRVRHEVDGLVPLSDGRALAIVAHEILELPNCPGVCGSTYTETEVAVYTASSNSWTLVPNMPEELIDTTVTLLSNGRVLVLGGRPGYFHDQYASESAQVYDPATGQWFTRGDMADPRVRHTATLLADGRVLAAGGSGLCCYESPHASSEAYVPADQRFASLPAMTRGREGHVAVRLADGRVLVAGGLVPGDPSYTEVVSATAEVFRPT